LPEKIYLNTKLSNISLIRQAVKLKFGKQITISSNINSNIRKIAKLGKLNASQVIENRVNQADKYSFAIKDLIFNLGSVNKNLTIEGYDISHHGGKHAVASAVRFSSHGPEKKNYRLFNIPKEFSGNDIASMRHVLERRINKKSINPLPNIILIDGGKLQLNVALSVFSILAKNSPMIISIVKGSKRVRSTETILSKDGIIEMPKDSPGFLLLQQIRDESHRFAITSNRKKKNKSINKSSLDNIKGLGPKKKKDLMNYFKSIKSIKSASIDDLCKVSGISIKLAEEINIFYRS
jgi:excinuclease ABC subunit C